MPRAAPLAPPPARLLALTRTVRRHPGAIPFVRRELARLGDDLSREDLANLQLVVTELVTNALLHGRGAIRLDVELSLTAARGHVIADGGGFSYRVAEADPMATSGRGLRIVDALTSSWGVAHDRSLVWFEIARGTYPLSPRGSRGR